MSERNDLTDPQLASAEDSGDSRNTTNNAGLSDEQGQLESANNELRDQLLRLRAEFDNFRRRVAREKEEIAGYATMESVRPMLTVVDDFERALGTRCSDPEYAKGVDLIYVRLLDTLKQLGVESIDAEGQPFDPNLHHAIEMVKTANAPDHTVIQVYQKGYLFKGKLLRPAAVQVAVKPDA